MSWKPNLSNCNGPKYKYLVQIMEEDIKNGVLLPGTKLPPQRELADYLDINLSTISRAFKLCEQKGLICASVGNGTYISSDVTTSGILLHEPDDQTILMGAIIPNIEYNSMVTNALQELLARPDTNSLFGYNFPNGNYSQNLAATTWMKKSGLDTDEAHILFASGGQNAIQSTVHAMCKPGDRIGCDSLTYPGLKIVAKMYGVQLIPLQTLHQEFTYESIQYAVKNENIKGIYTICDYHNPKATIMSMDSRKILAKAIKDFHLFLIEDGINTRLTPHPLPPVASLAPENTIYLASVSKTLCPGLRTAYLHTPLAFRDAIYNALYATNVCVSPLNAELSAHIINTGIDEQIITKRKQDIKNRNQIVNELLQDFIIDGDLNSPLRFLHLPDYFTGKSFEMCAKEAGVQVYGTERFSVGSATPLNGVRLSITTPTSIEQLTTGLEKIKKLLSQYDDFSYLG